MSAFVHNESYKHLLAKQVLKGWLEECDDSFHRKIENVHFRSNRECGVWLEYPFASVKNNKQIRVDGELYTTIEGNSWQTNWDELIAKDEQLLFNGFVPTYEQCKDMGANVFAVIDIVCAHKGRPLYAIEICHKNPVSKEKLEKIKNSGFDGELYEIQAEWILCQTSMPDRLKWNKLFGAENTPLLTQQWIKNTNGNSKNLPTFLNVEDVLRCEYVSDLDKRSIVECLRKNIAYQELKDHYDSLTGDQRESFYKNVFKTWEETQKYIENTTITWKGDKTFVYKVNADRKIEYKKTIDTYKYHFTRLT